MTRGRRTRRSRNGGGAGGAATADRSMAAVSSEWATLRGSLFGAACPRHRGAVPSRPAAPPSTVGAPLSMRGRAGELVSVPNATVGAGRGADVDGALAVGVGGAAFVIGAAVDGGTVWRVNSGDAPRRPYEPTRVPTASGQDRHHHHERPRPAPARLFRLVHILARPHLTAIASGPNSRSSSRRIVSIAARSWTPSSGPSHESAGCRGRRTEVARFRCRSHPRWASCLRTGRSPSARPVIVSRRRVR
jgi:hypothetical protein